MGGNARVIDINRRVKQWRGKPAFAEKIDLTKIPRQTFVSDIIDLLKTLNHVYSTEYYSNIWHDYTITNGIIFNGSSELLMDPSISDDEFLQYKRFVGDIDITVDRSMQINFWTLLQGLEGQHVTDKIIYVGSNKPTLSSVGNQINCIFEYVPTKTLFQIDWELVNYEFLGTQVNEDIFVPIEWEKFSKSANWNDIKHGIKGVFHKYLVRAVCRVISRISNIVILTPSSPEGSIEEINVIKNAIKKENNKDRIDDLKRELKLITPKISKPTKNQHSINRIAFSILHGIREKIRNTGVLVECEDGTYTGVKILPIDNEIYLNDPKAIFSYVIGHESNEHEFKKFYSFIGLLELLVQNSDLEKITKELIQLLWGIDYDSALSFKTSDDLKYGAQALDRDSWEHDRHIKLTALDYILKNYNLKLDRSIIEHIMNIYYGKNGEAYYRLRSGPSKDD